MEIRYCTTLLKGGQVALGPKFTTSGPHLGWWRVQITEHLLSLVPLSKSEARSGTGQDQCKGGATSGRTETSIPKIPSPAPNHRKKWIFLDNQKMEPPNSMVPKVAETK